jgi:hypothetical protein
MKSSDLLLHLEAYIALKRAVGFPLGARERLLRDFVVFIEDNGIRGTISVQVALDWACSASDRCGISRRGVFGEQRNVYGTRSITALGLNRFAVFRTATSQE